MAIDEAARHQLHRRLEEVLGAQEAAALMAHLPPVGWADVATKHDLDHLGAILTMKIDAVQSRMEAGLKSEISGVGMRIDALGARIESVETGLGTRIEGLDTKIEAFKHEVLATSRADLLRQTHTFLLGLAGLVVAMAGLLFAALRLA